MNNEDFWSKRVAEIELLVTVNHKQACLLFIETFVAAMGVDSMQRGLVLGVDSFNKLRAMYDYFLGKMDNQ